MIKFKTPLGAVSLAMASLTFSAAAHAMGAKSPIAPFRQLAPGEPKTAKQMKDSPLFLASEPKGAVTVVAFVDNCNDTAIALTPPDSQADNAQFDTRVSLVALITGLDPGAEVWVKMQVGPVSFETTNLKQIKSEKRYVANDRGELMVRQNVNIIKWKSVKTPSVVVGRMDWIQKSLTGRGSSRSGGSSASIAMPATDLAYRADPQPLCYWQSPVAIVSDYRFNPSVEADTNIMRTQTVDAYVGHTFGLGVGLGTFPEGPIESHDPLGSAPGGIGIGPGAFGNPFLGSFGLNKGYLWDEGGIWFVERWEKTYGTIVQTKLEEDWTLHSQDGGFFGERYTFTRFKAQSYKRSENGMCSSWIPVQSGYLDLGIASETLYSVPQSLSGKPKEAQAFMERLLPALNTCGDQPQDNERHESAIKSDGHMYFYPN